MFYTSKDRPVVRYGTGATVYEECLHDGRFVGLYWSSTGQVQRENIVSEMAGSNAFAMEIDGQSLHTHWEWVGGETRGEETAVSLVHNIRPVSVRVVTRLDGTGAICRRLEITNTGDRPAALSGLAVFSGILWDTRREMPYDRNLRPVFKLGYLKSVKWGSEGDFAWKTLTEDTPHKPVVGSITRLERKSYEGFSSPYWIVQNEASGEGFTIGLAWSGEHYAEFRAGESLSVSVGPAGSSPLRVIAPGETVTSPLVHILPASDPKLWHRHLRTSVIPKRPPGKEMYTVAARVVEEPGDWIRREIDIAARMGVEAYMVDAGWYGEKFGSWTANRGDWFEGDFLPEGGMAGLREHAHKHGMLFGLWMEPECLSSTSRTAAEHPEWQLGGNVLDLSNPEAASYMERSVRRVFAEIRPDFFKIDCNQRAPEVGRPREGYMEDTQWRHYECLYGLFARVGEEFPHVARENCAGGGGRNDLAMLARFHYACESDWSVLPYSIRAINAMTRFIPPESLCYYHNHLAGAHFTADMDTHLRVTLFALPIYVGFGGQNAVDGVLAERTRRYIELHKGFCRRVLTGSPDVFHHTPNIGLLDPAEFCVLEYALPDKSAGYAGVFRLGASEEYRLRLGGVDRSRTYRVTFDNDGESIVATGQELKETGVLIRLNRVHSSELIFYTNLEQQP